VKNVKEVDVMKFPEFLKYRRTICQYTKCYNHILNALLSFPRSLWKQISTCLFGSLFRHFLKRFKYTKVEMKFWSQEQRTFRTLQWTSRWTTLLEMACLLLLSQTQQPLLCLCFRVSLSHCVGRSARWTNWQITVSRSS